VSNIRADKGGQLVVDVVVTVDNVYNGSSDEVVDVAVTVPVTVVVIVILVVLIIFFICVGCSI